MTEVRSSSGSLATGFGELAAEIAERVRASSREDLRELEGRMVERIEQTETRLCARMDALEKRLTILVGVNEKSAESRSEGTKKLVEEMAKDMKSNIDVLRLVMDSKVIEINGPLKSHLEQSERMAGELRESIGARLGENEKAIGVHVDRVGEVVDSAYSRIRLRLVEANQGASIKRGGEK